MVGLTIPLNFLAIRIAELLSVLTFKHYNVVEVHHGCHGLSSLCGQYFAIYLRICLYEQQIYEENI